MPEQGSHNVFGNKFVAAFVSWIIYGFCLGKAVNGVAPIVAARPKKPSFGLMCGPNAAKLMMVLGALPVQSTFVC